MISLVFNLCLTIEMDAQTDSDHNLLNYSFDYIFSLKKKDSQSCICTAKKYIYDYLLWVSLDQDSQIHMFCYIK